MQEALRGLDPEVHKWQFAQTAATRALIDPDPAGTQLGAIRKDAGFWRLFAQMQIARRRPQQAEALLATVDSGAMFREERAERPEPRRSIAPPAMC